MRNGRGLALTSDWKQLLEKWDSQGVLQGRDAENPDPRMRLVNRRRAIARSFMEWTLGKQANLREQNERDYLSGALAHR